MTTTDDILNEQWMRRAVELSKKGLPAPNPHVGCVIVKNGQLVGEGFHEFAGGPHAEVAALKQAGSRASGATVFCTLEPCNHHGRTPPCSEALVRAGIREIYFACSDPYPDAAGGGGALAEAGVKIHRGLLEYEAKSANQQFLFSVMNQRPLVTVKVAMTLDGRTTNANGESKWITCEEARRDSQRLRAVCGSVLIGSVTAQKDRARLTVRDWPVKNQPLRVVIDRKRKLSSVLPVFDDTAPSWWVSEGELEWNEDGLNLNSLLSELYERGVRGLMVEGGSTTISTFLQAGLVDRIVGYSAPKIFGVGQGWADQISVVSPDDSEVWQWVSVEKIGRDLKWVVESTNFCRWKASK